MFDAHQIALGAIFVLGTTSQVASAATPPPGKPVILSSSASATQLTIDGSGFLPGTASVLLGQYGPLAVVSQTSSQLIATLPPAIKPGSYVLSVQLGKNSDESVAVIRGPKWASLGYLGALIRDPDMSACDQRIINHNVSPPIIFMPTMKFATYQTFYFALDLHALGFFADGETMQQARAIYLQTPEPKTFTGSVSRVAPDYWSVSVEVNFLDESSGGGNGVGVSRDRVPHYELQESCN
jgi:hypothetical protein